MTSTSGAPSTSAPRRHEHGQGEHEAPGSRPRAHGHRAEMLTGLVRGASLTTVGAVLNAGLGFVLTVVIARSLGVHDSGMLFTGTALFTLVAVLGKMGADTGLVRELARRRPLGRYREDRRLLLLALLPVLLATTALGAAAWTASDVLAGIVFEDAAESGGTVLRALALALPFGALSLVAVAASRGLGDLVPLVVVENIGKPALRVVLCLVVGLVGGGLTAMVWAWAAPALLACAVGGLLLARRMRGAQETEQEPPLPWRRLAGPFWSFAGPRGVAAALDVANSSVGILCVSALSGPGQAAVLAGSMRYAVAGTLGLQAIRLVVMAPLSQLLSAGDVKGAESLHQTTTLLAVALTGPLYVLLALHAGTALSLLGDDFSAGAPVLVLLCAAMMVNLVTGNVQVVLLMGGRSGTNLAAVLTSLLLNIALAALLVPSYGAVAAAGAWAAAVCLENLWYARAARRRMGVHTFTRQVWVLLAIVGGCFLVPGLVLEPLLGRAWWSLLLQLVVSVCAYLALLYVNRGAFSYADVLVAKLRRSVTGGTAG